MHVRVRLPDLFPQPFRIPFMAKQNVVFQEETLPDSREIRADFERPGLVDVGIDAEDGDEIALAHGIEVAFVEIDAKNRVDELDLHADRIREKDGAVSVEGQGFDELANKRHFVRGFKRKPAAADVEADAV